MRISIKINHEHNRHEVERIIGKTRLKEAPDRFHLTAEIPEHEEPWTKILMLNHLHGVIASAYCG